MRVPLDSLKAGMALAADLREAGGRLLLPSGTELTERHLRYMQMWGIGDVEIVGAGPETSDSSEPIADPAVLAAAEARTAAHFRLADLQHPVVGLVYRHCVARAVRAGAEGPAHGD